MPLIPALAAITGGRRPPPRQRCAAKSRGFTLMELLIAVAIVAILTTIALPTYESQLRKGNRAAAQAYLLDLAQRQQQYLLDARRYADTEAALGLGATPSTVSPYYTITIATPATSPPTFTITATAIGSQAKDVASLSVDSTGTRTPSDKW